MRVQGGSSLVYKRALASQVSQEFPHTNFIRNLIDVCKVFTGSTTGVIEFSTLSPKVTYVRSLTDLAKH